MHRARLLLATLLIATAHFLAAPGASADEPPTLQIWIPSHVTVVENETKVVFIGRPTSTSAIICPLGVAQTAMVVDPGGGTAAQIVGVSLVHDHEMRPATRYTITHRDFSFCIGGMELYSATLD